MEEKEARPTAGGANETRTARTGTRRGLFVGIGASAGALEALESFFAHMPRECGLAFVVVQHLERHHPSVLAELLGKHTQMPVVQAEDGARAQPNHVYVIPPDAVLTLERAILKVARPAGTGLRMPVDAFFHSLAQDQGEAAVGIILSGTGSDGTSGVRAIKEHGGLTLAQAPETARYDSMPESAITAGLVDAALPVEEMPARLVAYAQHLSDIQRGEVEHFDDDIAAQLQPVCGILLRHTGHDFSRYKEGTLIRRIGRRVRIQDATSVQDYVQRLEQDSAEAEALVRDLSIGVTHFFRDAEVFETLAEKCLPAILDSGDSSKPVRIWVPGCATGEEAYSIAILVREHLARQQTMRTVQLFATDIDSELVATARQGRYADDIRQHVSAESLARFFRPEDGGFQVIKELRDMCTFSVHSLIKDPPFSTLDLISCRNVLIYLGADLQKKLVPLFHFALRPGGYLLLGPSEDLAAHGELFTRVERQHRLFQRNDAAVRPLELPLSGRLSSRGTLQGLAPKSAALIQPPMLSQALERMIREEYAPPCVVINERGDILYLTGQTGRYLQAREGTPTNNILDQAQTSLRLELRTALAAAVQTRRAIVRTNVLLDSSEPGGPLRPVRLTVRPLPGVPTDAGLYAVVLQESQVAADLEADPVTDASASVPERDRLIIVQLEEELRTTRAELQSSAEELETSNEELKSANEELISTNEELQSANEELQSSREELQTVNDELREKVQALDIAQGDLQSHYASSRIATIFLDRDLRITRFTPAATALFRMIEADVGRPISDLAPRVRHEGLLQDAQSVLRTEQTVERHVVSADGAQAFLMRILPYRDLNGVVAGVGLTFVDVTDLMLAEAAAREDQALLRAIIDTIADPIFVKDAESRLVLFNPATLQVIGKPLEQVIGHNDREFFDDPAAAEAILEHDRQVMQSGTVHVFEETVPGPSGDRVMLNTKAPRRDAAGRIIGVVGVARDITERKQAEAALRASEERYRTLFNTMIEGFCVIEVIFDSDARPIDYRFLEVNEAFEAQTGLTGAQGRCIRELAPENESYWFEIYGSVALTGRPVRFVNEARALGRWYDVSAYRVGGSESRKVAILFNDISERKRIETALELVNQRLLEEDRRKNEFLAMLSHELRNPLAPIINSAYVLERAAPGGDQAKGALAVIERQAGQLAHLVDDLLDITWITRNKIQLQCQTLELNELVRRTIEDRRSIFEKAGLRLEFRPSPGPVFVSADSNRLAQIVGNLLQNSVKFTSRGGAATVTIHEDAAQKFAVIQVADTGVGMAPEMVTRLFEPFSQADSTLDRSQGGLGLGLALVKGLVELHGGDVAARSAGLGKGAEFVVRLPLTMQQAAAPQPGQHAAIGHRRVLIIEDNVDGADSLREVLELSGHEVEVAYNGPDGMVKARKFRPDVVLCDIGLPGMNGYEIARAFRADDAVKGAFLIALSGYALPEDLQRAREAGFQRHLAKPPSLEKLESLLAEAPCVGEQS